MVVRICQRLGNIVWFNTISIPFTRVIANEPTTEFPNYEVVVMPNPFHHQTIIALKGAPMEGTVFIFNALGQKVIHLPLQNNQAELIRNNMMESGVYFYQIANQDKGLISSGAMIIQRN